MSKPDDQIEPPEPTSEEEIKYLRQDRDQWKNRFDYSSIECSFAIQERDQLKQKLTDTQKHLRDANRGAEINSKVSVALARNNQGLKQQLAGLESWKSQVIANFPKCGACVEAIVCGSVSVTAQHTCTIQQLTELRVLADWLLLEAGALHKETDCKSQCGTLEKITAYKTWKEKNP